MTFTIAAATREAGNADALRKDARIPAVVYGPEIDPISISVSYRDFDKLYNEAGESSLIDLAVEGLKETVTVLIQDVQYDPVKGTIQHADFRQINMGEAIDATVELTFVGQAPAVKELGGTLNANLDSVSVTCLPKDLVSHIDVDLSVLATFDDAITIADLQLPEGVEVTDAPDTLVANVSAPLTEEQLAAMEATQDADVDSVEVEGKKKDEESGESKEKDDSSDE